MGTTSFGPQLAGEGGLAGEEAVGAVVGAVAVGGLAGRGEHWRLLCHSLGPRLALALMLRAWALAVASAKAGRLKVVYERRERGAETEPLA